MQSRLREVYEKKIVPELVKEFWVHKYVRSSKIVQNRFEYGRW